MALSLFRISKTNQFLTSFSNSKRLFMSQNIKRTISFLLTSTFLIFFLGVTSIQTYAQALITVSGRVVDAETSKPIAGVTVAVKNSKIAAITSENGTYSIKASVGAVLVFTYQSFTSEELKVKSATESNVSLKKTSENLGEVVVIGYGTRKKADLTGAVSTVGSKDIEKSTSMTAELALQGNAPGVFVESGGGAPGARPTIRIRGVNTFGFAEPLYVIDGLPIFEGGAGVTEGAIGDIRSGLNILTLINPSDIESMTVLKDASAAAIYGVRASNGVILITTKKGKSGKPRVEITSSYGVQNIPRSIATLNTQQYFALLRESYAANPDAGISFEQRFGDRYNSANPLFMGDKPTFDWQNELKNKNASLQNYTAKLSGGNDNTTYMFSAGYSKTQSPLKANELERYTLSLNIDSKVSKYVQVGMNIRMAQQNAVENTGADLGTMMSTIPFQPIYDINDPTGFAPASAGSFEPNPAFDPSLISPGAPFNFVGGGPTLIWGPQTRFNVFARQQVNSLKYDLFNTIANAFIQIEPITGLKIKGSLGGQYSTNLKKAFNAFDDWRFNQTPPNPYANQDGNAKGRYGERGGNTFNINKELTLNYTKSFGDHSIDVILGASEQYSRWRWTDISGNVNFTNRQYWAIGNQPPYSGASGSLLQEDALLGYLARASYKFKDKYFLDATMRRDGSSRLAPGNKFDNFPSVGAAWRISSERFFPKINFINDLKLRGGWGLLGNFQSAGAYQYFSNVSLNSDYPLGSGNGNNGGTQIQGAALPNFANTSLTWEKVRTASFGLDAVLFQNRMNITLEYYNKTTFDIIQSVGLPPNTGIQQNADLNIATVRNSGIELQLGYNNKIGDLNYTVSGNITTVRNRVVKLNDGASLGWEGGRIQEGMSMFYLWGHQVGGVFQNQAEIDAWNLRNSKGDAFIGGNVYKPGDMWFRDVQGAKRAGQKEDASPFPDSAVNSDDRTYLGKTIPGFYYGFNFNAEYKGFDLTIFFQGVGDVKKYNYTRSGLESMSGSANQWATTLNRWTPSNPASVMPRAVFGDPFASTRFSSRFVESGAYLRLRNLQLGYTLPANLTEKLKFAQRVRVYMSAINLFTITGYSGLDPENDGVPVTRQFVFGINASF